MGVPLRGSLTGDRRRRYRAQLALTPIHITVDCSNRPHIDFGTADREDEVGRLLALGATRIGDHDEWGAVWTTLADVEGNEFCVVQRS